MGQVVTSGWRRLAVASLLGVGLIGAVGDMTQGMAPDDWLFLTAMVPLALVGSVLVLRVPSNPLSWMLYAVALGIGVVSVVDLIGNDLAYDLAIGIYLFAVLIPVFGVMVPLLFPTGSPPSLRWRWVTPVTWVAVTGMWIALILEGVVTGDVTGDVSCTSVLGCVANAGVVVILFCVVSAVVSFVLRWRRSTGVEREQLRWLVPPFIALMIGVVGEFGGGQGGWVANVFLPLGLFLVPVAMGIAITRYRLYEIDRIISRTVTYAVVAGVLAGAVAGVAAMVGTRFDSPPVVAATTLGVAAVFNPLRRRVQRVVDRRFNRSRYDAERVMDDFAATLRDMTGAEEVVAGWMASVETTMNPSAVGVWVR
jgi:hypothetical protein